jgi:integrase
MIKRQINQGTFCFEEEFPDYKLLRRLNGASKVRLCNEVFDEYLAHCDARLKRGDLAAATVSAYRKILSGVWRPQIGELIFYTVRYSHLIAIADGRNWSKKTYNNGISVLRRAFDFGYRDRPLEQNPARCLRGARLRKADRPKIDPFCMHDAETFIAALHRDWGEAHGNYDEFRFFTGLRPSEQIALVLSDLDLDNGIVSVNKARVSGVDRSKTKTGEDRRIQLCPRALEVLKRHLRFRQRLAAEGKIDHDFVFVHPSGKAIRNLGAPARRWRKTLRSLHVRYRRPYTARHSSVSWNLMVGRNLLWVAKQHGHRIVTMLQAYAAWAEGAVEGDVQAIERSMKLTLRQASLDRPIARCRHGRRAALEEATSLPAADNLAADLPVAQVIEAKCAREVTGAALPVQDPSHCSSSEIESERELAGVAGFEPTYGGIKTRCLTTWRHPNSGARASARYSNLARRNSSSDPARARPRVPRPPRWRSSRTRTSPCR